MFQDEKKIYIVQSTHTGQERDQFKYSMECTLSPFLTLQMFPLKKLQEFPVSHLQDVT